MRTSRFEIRRITLGLPVEVNSVHPRRQVVQADLHQDSRLLTRQHRGSNTLALSVLQFDRGLGGRLGRDHDG